MINKKIIICATVKNEAKNLKKFFEILENIRKGFNDYFLIFVENNSFDQTTTIIKNYLSLRKGCLISQEIDEKFNRIKSLEVSRNKYLNYIRSNTYLLNYDYLLILDADGVNNKLNISKLSESLNIKEDWTAIFASQKYYYDIFALRIPGYIENNYIEKIKEDINNKQKLPPKKIIEENLTKFLFFLNKFSERFIKVKSAFGGCGIYKLNRIIEFNYDSYNGKECEHVSLNSELYSKYGNMFIDKNLINSSGINKHTINSILCSKFNFFANKFIKKIS